ncbi:MAG: prepilin-type N-terminal cleavage/methylation domain-containing protein [candidate division NC10 bacterium]
MGRVRCGYTLVELLMVVVIMFVAVGGLVLVLNEAGRNTWLTTQAQGDSQTEAQRVIDRISEDVRNASRAQVRCAAAAPQLQIGLDGAPTEIEYTFAGGGGTGTLGRSVGVGGASITLASRLMVFTCSPIGANPAGGFLTIQVTSRGVARITAAGARNYDQALTASVFIQLP